MHEVGDVEVGVVDACSACVSTYDIWRRVERKERTSERTELERHGRLTNVEPSRQVVLKTTVRESTNQKEEDVQYEFSRHSGVNQRDVSDIT